MAADVNEMWNVLSSVYVALATYERIGAITPVFNEVQIKNVGSSINPRRLFRKRGREWKKSAQICCVLYISILQKCNDCANSIVHCLPLFTFFPTYLTPPRPWICWTAAAGTCTPPGRVTATRRARSWRRRGPHRRGRSAGLIPIGWRWRQRWDRRCPGQEGTRRPPSRTWSRGGPTSGSSSFLES